MQALLLDFLAPFERRCCQAWNTLFKSLQNRSPFGHPSNQATWFSSPSAQCRLKSFNWNGVWGTNCNQWKPLLDVPGIPEYCSAHETQAPSFHPAQALQYFIFMKLRPLVFILCKHFTISFSWSSGPRFSSCARMSPFNFHESQSHVFSLCNNVTIIHHLIFMSLSLMFSACACTSPLTFHESQAHVFSHCEQLLPSFFPIP